MTLGFKTQVQGNPTFFALKILTGMGTTLQPGPDLESFMADTEAYGIRPLRPKIHTLRENYGRWQPGMAIHFATGVRSRNYRCFAHGTCQAVQHVSMKFDSSGQIMLAIHQGGQPGRWYLLDEDELLRFAHNDGFESVAEFVEWFKPLLKPTETKRFALIHWTPMVYSFVPRFPSPTDPSRLN